MIWINKFGFCPSACCKVVPAANGWVWLLGKMESLLYSLNMLIGFIYRISKSQSCSLGGEGGVKVWKLASSPCSTKILLTHFSPINLLTATRKQDVLCNVLKPANLMIKPTPYTGYFTHNSQYALCRREEQPELCCISLQLEMWTQIKYH